MADPDFELNKILDKSFRWDPQSLDLTRFIMLIKFYFIIQRL